MTRRLRRNGLIVDNPGIDFLQHLSQLFAEVVHVLKAIFWVFCEGPFDDLCQTRRDWSRAQLGDRSRWIIENCVSDIDRRLRSEERRVGKECRSRWWPCR